MKLKKTVLIITALLVSSLLYAKEEEETKIVLPSATETETDTSDTYEADVYEEETIKPNVTKAKPTGDGLKNFFLGSQNFPELEESQLSFKNVMKKLVKEECVFTYLEKKDLAGVGFAVTGSYYYVLFDKKNRQKLTEAADKYFSDFENKKLNRKNRKSFKEYDTVNLFEYFGVTKTKAINYATPLSHYGYNFYEGSPYFTITCYPSTNFMFIENPAYQQDSNQIEIYLTKAQLRKLVDFMAEDKINSYKSSSKFTADSADEY